MRHVTWLALLCAGCAPPSSGALELVPLDGRTVALVQDEQTLAAVRLESVDLDRLDADLSSGGGLAAVVHHGRFGGASLLLLGEDGAWRREWSTAADEDLSRPRWTPDGAALLLVRRLPPRWVRGDPPRLEHRGELWQVEPRGRSVRLTGLENVSRIIGWDPEGRLLLTRFATGDMGTNETLARLDLADGAFEDLDAPVPPIEPSWSGRTPAPPSPARLLSSLTMPYVHQVYDTPNDFNGNWACGPTSTLMAVQHFGRLPKWPVTVNIPSSHTSDYGAYVAYKYSAFGNTFDRVQNDASGKPAKGAYGWCTDGGGAWAWRMQDYAKRHDLKSDFSGSPSFSAVESALNAGKVVVLSTQLTSAGHIITVKGTDNGKLVVNDPYGDRNLPSYPNTKGENAVYTWAKVASKWYITVYGTPSAPAEKYKAELVDSSYPKTLAAGAKASATIKYKNKGSESWDTGKTRLGTTEPRDRASEFFTSGDWVGSNRAAAASDAAVTDQTATFSFTLTAPRVCEDTSYTEHFNLVQEGVAWFSDSGQGGPDDKALALEITVTAVDADGDGAADCAAEDCDDSDPAVYPGATEACNGKDDNCDGQVDEGCAGTDAGLQPDARLPGPAPDSGPQRSSLTGDGLVGGCQLGGAPTDLPLPLLLLLALLCARTRRLSRQPRRNDRNTATSPGLPE